MKLVISGVPCCGKTHFGDWLRDSNGFDHIDLESTDAVRHQVIADLQVELKNIRTGRPSLSNTAFSRIATLEGNVVVTWGFPPNDHCFNLIKCLQHSGLSAWWFHADFGVARTRYVQRDGEAATRLYFDPQAQRLRDAKPLLDILYAGRMIETLNARGYIPVERVFEHIRNGEAV